MPASSAKQAPGKVWFVYIAESCSGKYYVGISTDVDKRINTHNAGKGAHLAKIDGPFVLKYTSPPLCGQSQARSCEIELKKWRRVKKEQLIAGALHWESCRLLKK